MSPQVARDDARPTPTVADLANATGNALFIAGMVLFAFGIGWAISDGGRGSAVATVVSAVLLPLSLAAQVAAWPFWRLASPRRVPSDAGPALANDLEER